MLVPRHEKSAAAAAASDVCTHSLPSLSVIWSRGTTLTATAATVGLLSQSAKGFALAHGALRRDGARYMSMHGGTKCLGQKDSRRRGGWRAEPKSRCLSTSQSSLMHISILVHTHPRVGLSSKRVIFKCVVYWPKGSSSDSSFMIQTTVCLSRERETKSTM